MPYVTLEPSQVGQHLGKPQLIAIAGTIAQAAGINPSVFIRQINQESGFNPNAHNASGADGIAQIVPKYHPGVDTRNPIASLQYAAKLMRSHLNQNDGSYPLALAAYNAGQGNVNKYHGVPPFAETQNYIRSILSGSVDAVTKAANQSNQQIQGFLKDLNWQEQHDKGLEHQAALDVADARKKYEQIPSSAYDGLTSFAEKADTKPAQAEGPNPLQGIGNFLGSIPGQVSGAVNQELQTAGKEGLSYLAKEPGRLAAGAGLGLADLYNGAVQLPADLGNAVTHSNKYTNLLPKIPTGGAQEMVQGTPVTNFVGQAIPWLASAALTDGGSLAAQGAEAAAPSLAKPIVHGALTGAAFGGLSDPNGGGLGGRAANAGVNAVLGGALGGGSALIGKAFGHGVAGDLNPGADAPAVADLSPISQAAAHDLGSQSISRGTHSNVEAAIQAAQPRPTELLNSQGGHLGAPIETPQVQIPAEYNLGEPISENTDLRLGGPRREPVEPVGSIETARALPAGRDLSPLPDAALDRYHQNLADIRDEVRTQGYKNVREFERQATRNLELGDASGLDTDTLQYHQDLLDALHENHSELERSMAEHDRLKTAAELAQQSGNTGELPDTETRIQNRPFEDKSESELNLRPGSKTDIIKEPYAKATDNVIEFPGKQTGPIELLGPNGRPIDVAAKKEAGPQASAEASTYKTDSGAEVFHQGADEQHVKGYADSLRSAVEGHGGQLLNIAEARDLLRRTGRGGTEHLNNFLEAGRQNQTLGMQYSSLQSGRGALGERTIHPTAIEARTISHRTELANLRKEFDGDYAAIRDNLIQRIRRNNGNVSASEASDLGGVAKQSKQLNALSRKLANVNKDELTHVYLHSHNLGDSTVGIDGATHRGYRLDTIKSSSLTGEGQAIPQHEAYQNTLPDTFKSLSDLPLPDRVKRQLIGGNLSNKSMAELKSILGNLSQDALNKICGIS